MLVLKNFLMQRYEFRRNEITSQIDYRKKDSTTFTTFDAEAKNNILVELDEHHVNATLQKLQTLLGSSFVQKYNPVLEYLSSLTWDGQDHLGELASLVQTDDDACFRRLFTKFMLATVAGWIHPDQYNEMMLILVGQQNTGKSTFARNLLPSTLDPGFIYQGTILKNEMDFVKLLSRKLFIILDEFDAINGRDVARLKELITRGVVEGRLAYQSSDMREMRRASFIATTNVGQPLKDLSGNRRYLIFSVKKIRRDIDVDLQQVYSQLYCLITRGEDFKLNIDEVAEINRRNERFVYNDIISDAISLRFKPTNDLAAERLTAKQIASEIMSETGNGKVNQNLLTTVGLRLKESGFERKRSNGSNYYYVERLSPSHSQTADVLINQALQEK